MKSLKHGDAAVEPNVIYGQCETCLTGRYNGCDNVLFRSTPPVPGLLRHYMTHPAVWCHKIGDTVTGAINTTFEEGASLKPLAVALAGLQRADVWLDDPVLMYGPDLICLMTLLCCRAVGAEPIVITDLNQKRLQFARDLVPSVRTYAIQNRPAEQAAREIVTAMSGEEPRVAIECAGVENFMAGAIQAVKFRGKVFVIGVGRNEIKIPFMRLSTREVDLQFQYRYADE